jgi:hypothetical protein
MLRRGETKLSGAREESLCLKCRGKALKGVGSKFTSPPDLLDYSDSASPFRASLASVFAAAIFFPGWTSEPLPYVPTGRRAPAQPSTLDLWSIFSLSPKASETIYDKLLILLALPRGIEPLFQP